MNKVSGEEHAKNLGMLIANMQTLEIAIRDFLFIDAKGLQAAKEHAQSLRKLKVGQSVLETPFTNYDNLGTLIRKYNKRVEAIAKELRVDETIVHLRDALAHGRVFSFEPSSSMILLKFSSSKDGYVEVEFSAAMTRDWFDKEIKRVKREFNKVVEANR